MPMQLYKTHYHKKIKIHVPFNFTLTTIRVLCNKYKYSIIVGVNCNLKSNDIRRVGSCNV